MDEYATFMHKPLLIIIGVVTIALGGASAEEQAGYGLGRPATDEEIRAWNIDVSPTGEGLPPGQGTAKQGAQIYAGKCAACHGLTGVEGPKDRLVGGRNTLTTQKPIKTIGSYWQWATTLFDYTRRAMPYGSPLSLTDDEAYAVTAYMLFLNGIVGQDEVMDAKTLPGVKMPNRDNFVNAYPNRPK